VPTQGREPAPNEVDEISGRGRLFIEDGNPRCTRTQVPAHRQQDRPRLGAFRHDQTLVNVVIGERLESRGTVGAGGYLCRSGVGMAGVRKGRLLRIDVTFGPRAAVALSLRMTQPVRYIPYSGSRPHLDSQGDRVAPISQEPANDRSFQCVKDQHYSFPGFRG
jgi:hypothetical protein